MAKSIVLSVGGINRTLTLVRTDGINSVYEEQTGPLLGRLRLTSSSKDNTAGTVVRTRLKLERSQVDVTSAAPGIAASTKVRYQEVWSDDITIVKQGESAGRTELYELKVALVSNDVIRDLVVDAVPL